MMEVLPGTPHLVDDVQVFVRFNAVRDLHPYSRGHCRDGLSVHEPSIALPIPDRESREVVDSTAPVSDASE